MATNGPVRELSVEAVAELLRAGDAVFLDANPASRHKRGHLPGAVLVDPGAVGEALPEDRTAPVVFYCRDRSCGAAPAAARRAVKLGFTDVGVMPDGIQGWVAAGLPVETG